MSTTHVFYDFFAPFINLALDKLKILCENGVCFKIRPVLEQALRKATTAIPFFRIDVGQIYDAGGRAAKFNTKGGKQVDRT